jgi:rhodanese-related sulfurtransferase
MGQIFFEDISAENYTFFDCRNAEAFCNGHFKNAIFVGDDEGIEDRLAILEPLPKNACYIVSDIESSSTLLKKAIVQSNSFLIWNSDIKISDAGFDLSIAVDLEEFLLDYKYDEFFLIDVRATDDFEKGSIEHAQSIPSEDLLQTIVELDPNKSYYIFGNNFEDALFATSIFKQNGFNLVRIVSCSYDEIAGQLKKK